MKVSSDFVIRKIVEEYVLIPIGDAALSFGSLASTNEVGYFLWEKLRSDCTQEALVEALLEEYDVDRATAEKDVDAFLNKLRQNKLLEE